MIAGLREELAARVRGPVEAGEPLSRHTSYRIGGPAGVLVRPASVDDVAATVRFAAASGRPWLVLGLGSNVLIADRGFDGIVLRIGQGLDRVAQAGPGRSHWTVGAGLPTPRLARQTARAGHAGLHRLIGVPGTVGGGVFMNAGAHGQDFSQVVRSALVVDGAGDVRTVLGGDIAWRYRSSGLDQMVVVETTLGLEPGDPAPLDQELKLHLRKRREGTPFEEPCCGSVFRNPPGSRTAGQLVDAAGLKGFRVGGAEVSSRHANYIVNTGSASAEDVRRVIHQVRTRVRERFGVALELEVRLIGFPEEEGHP